MWQSQCRGLAPSALPAGERERGEGEREREKTMFSRGGRRKL